MYNQSNMQGVKWGVLSGNLSGVVQMSQTLLNTDPV